MRPVRRHRLLRIDDAAGLIEHRIQQIRRHRAGIDPVNHTRKFADRITGTDQHAKEHQHRSRPERLAGDLDSENFRRTIHHQVGAGDHRGRHHPQGQQLRQRTIQQAIERHSKPKLALELVLAAAAPESPGVPPVLLEAE